ARWRALLETLQAFYYSGSFIGGQPNLGTAGYREDVLAQMSWELRNFGLGDLYRARENRARYDAAQYRLVETQARVAAEVVSAAKIVRQRERTLRDSQAAVRNAEEMWRKLEAVAFGVGLPARQYDPLEPLLAERALLEARNIYLDNVIEYNRAQFRLFWAMGQPPMCAQPRPPAQPLEVPVEPGPEPLRPAVEGGSPPT